MPPFNNSPEEGTVNMMLPKLIDHFSERNKVISIGGGKGHDRERRGEGVICQMV